MNCRRGCVFSRQGEVVSPLLAHLHMRPIHSAWGPACCSQGERDDVMNQSALVFVFGSVSSAAVGSAFLYKWWAEDRRHYDRDWAISYLALAAAIGLASLLESAGSVSDLYVAPLCFWLFACYLVTANLSFTGRETPPWAPPLAAFI